MSQDSSRSPDVPRSLWQQCLDYCIQHPNTLCHIVKPGGHYILYNWVYLPMEVCHSLQDAFINSSQTLDDRVMNLFTDTSRTRLKRLILRDSFVTDSTLTKLLEHDITQLDVSGCSRLSSNVVRAINSKCRNLRILNIGGSTGIPFHWERPPDGSEPADIEETRVFRCPQLEMFTVHDLKAAATRNQEQVLTLIANLLQPLHALTYLDLSGCWVHLDNLEQIGQLHLLRSLVLHNVQVLSQQPAQAFEKLVAIKQLR